jgi:hypothetical protein
VESTNFLAELLSQLAGDKQGAGSGEKEKSGGTSDGS